jgi:amidase
MKMSFLTKLLIFIILFAILIISGCKNRPEFQIDEATIAQIHEAMKAGDITCRQLVEHYLKRIEAYDQSTKLNSIVVVNPKALKTADDLDQEFKRTGKLRPLHGIPVIVKDNYDTYDLQTTGGSMALKGSIPPDDAFQVKKIREAGAIVLAKSNMAEWAFSPYVSESSIAGTTRNPYDLERVPAGSSGGTAAAVAANFGAVGLGTDTGNSIRGPSSHNCLVGIRSSMGLASRDGIIPLFLRNDIGGPICRTVEDAARVLEVIAGYDPADPITKYGEGKIPDSYRPYLDKDGLKGARLGVFRRYYETEGADPQVKAVMEKAIEDLKQLGAEIVDPFDIPDFDKNMDHLWCDTFKHDVNEYLASLGDRAPYKDITDIYHAGLYSKYIEGRFKEAMAVDQNPADMNPPCLNILIDPRNMEYREQLLAAMEKDKIEAIIYPTWSNPPRKVGDDESPAGDNSQLISPPSGLPALTVPMGFTYGHLPAGLQFVGKLYDEPTLIKFAYAYEQGTRHRRPPEKFPPLKKES